MTLQELDSLVHEKDVQQKTIDLVQNAYMEFFDVEDFTKDSDQVVAYIYEVDICLEIYNPLLIDDIEILKELIKTLEAIK